MSTAGTRKDQVGRGQEKANFLFKNSGSNNENIAFIQMWAMDPLYVWHKRKKFHKYQQSCWNKVIGRKK